MFILKEDTAKSSHEGGKTLIDFNKSGMPLIEIVTAPDFRSSEEAVEFCKSIYEIVKACDISDADMEKGQMRLEANISLRTQEMEQAGMYPSYKVEIKRLTHSGLWKRRSKQKYLGRVSFLQVGEKSYKRTEVLMKQVEKLYHSEVKKMRMIIGTFESRTYPSFGV